MKNIFYLILCVFFLCILCVNLFSNPVSEEYAKQIAFNFYKANCPEFINDFTLSEVKEVKYDNTITYFIFSFKNKLSTPNSQLPSNDYGFVLVSADDAAIPILGYSYEGNYKSDIINPKSEILWWCTNYSKEIKYIIDNKISNASTINQWTDIFNQTLNTKHKIQNTQSVTPFIKTKWDQNAWYNEQCPADAAGDCGHVYAGCVATAMAQVMKYYSFPSKGKGTHTDSVSNYGKLTVNFGNATYNWNSMPNQISGSNSEVAKLIYHCSVAIDTRYGPYGSGAGIETVPMALSENYGYERPGESVYIEDYSAADWKKMIKTELDSARPVIYSGFDISQGAGHSFVCDGYDNTGLFHFSCGWSGNYDGYYAIGSVTTPNGNWNSDNAMLIHISPKFSHVGISELTTPNSLPLLYIYPNPVSRTATITIKANTAQNVSLLIFNSLGDKVQNVRLSASGFKFVWDVTYLKNGIYYAKLLIGNTILTKKITVIK